MRKHQPSVDTRRVTCTDMEAKNIEIIGKPPVKFSPEDWDYNTKLKFKISEEQEKLAERVIAESQRVIDEIRDTNKILKRETDHQLQTRTTEVKFLIDELEKQKQLGEREEEALKMYKTRIMNCIKYLRETSLHICQKCIVMRDKRIGGDMVNDVVDFELNQELKTIKGCMALIEKITNELNEQIRRLRAALYLLDRDLQNKDVALKIDQENLKIKETQCGLYAYQGDVSLNQGDYSLKEWEHVTYQNIKKNAQELNSATQLRSYIEILFKQVMEDMRTQMERTNEAFRQRISEIRHVKDRLEKLHSETITHVNDVNMNITTVDKELADKEGLLAVCQMRLGNRAQRPELELTKDAAHSALMAEFIGIKNSIKTLSEKRTELLSTLRYLLHAQMMQEEEMNIKNNTLKIDEVDCMTSRLNLHYDDF